MIIEKNCHKRTNVCQDDNQRCMGLPPYSDEKGFCGVDRCKKRSDCLKVGPPRYYKVTYYKVNYCTKKGKCVYHKIKRP